MPSNRPVLHAAVNGPVSGISWRGSAWTVPSARRFTRPRPSRSVHTPRHSQESSPYANSALDCCALSSNGRTHPNLYRGGGCEGDTGSGPWAKIWSHPMRRPVHFTALWRRTLSDFSAFSRSSAWRRLCRSVTAR